MREVLWSDFLNGKFYINCQTESEAYELLCTAEQYGVLWIDGTEPSKFTAFSGGWREETCYYISKFRMVYNGIRFVHDKGVPILKYSKIKLVDNYSTSKKRIVESDYVETICNMLRIFGIDDVKKFLSCSAYFYRCLDEKHPNNGHIEFAKCCENYLNVIEGVKNNE